MRGFGLPLWGSTPLVDVVCVAKHLGVFPAWRLSDRGASLMSGMILCLPILFTHVEIARCVLLSVRVVYPLYTYSLGQPLLSAVGGAAGGLHAL
jgi:hypothetical protein